MGLEAGPYGSWARSDYLDRSDFEIGVVMLRRSWNRG